MRKRPHADRLRAVVSPRSNRRSGRGARGSSNRASRARNVVTVMFRDNSERSAIRFNTSMSRTIWFDLVMTEMLSPSRFANSSRHARVTPYSRSAGWYGSVAVPMAICSGRPSSDSRPLVGILSRYILRQQSGPRSASRRFSFRNRRRPTPCIRACIARSSICRRTRILGRD